VPFKKCFSGTWVHLKFDATAFPQFAVSNSMALAWNKIWCPSCGSWWLCIWLI